MWLMNNRIYFFYLGTEDKKYIYHQQTITSSVYQGEINIENSDISPLLGNM